MVNYNFPNSITRETYIKQSEKYFIKKKSSGVGFFVFAYFIISLVLSIAFTLFIDFDNISLYYVDIIISCFCPLIAGLFYILISRTSLSEIISVKYVKLKIFLPLVFIGLALAMVANSASELLATNFSIFNLKNGVSTDFPSKTPFEFILSAIAISITPALAEEFAFRGVFMGALRKFGDSFAIITSAIIFGAMHGNISQVPFAFILGLILGYAVCKTNSLITSIAIHFLNNFYAIVMDTISKTLLDSNAISYNQVSIIYCVLVFAFCLLGLVSFIYLLHKKSFNLKLSNTGEPTVLAIPLTMKEKMSSFFANPGIIITIVLFGLQTILNLQML